MLSATNYDVHFRHVFSISRSRGATVRTHKREAAARSGIAACWLVTRERTHRLPFLQRYRHESRTCTSASNNSKHSHLHAFRGMPASLGLTPHVRQRSRMRCGSARVHRRRLSPRSISCQACPVADHSRSWTEHSTPSRFGNCVAAQMERHSPGCKYPSHAGLSRYRVRPPIHCVSVRALAAAVAPDIVVDLVFCSTNTSKKRTAAVSTHLRTRSQCAPLAQQQERVPGSSAARPRPCHYCNAGRSSSRLLRQLFFKRGNPPRGLTFECCLVELGHRTLASALP